MKKYRPLKRSNPLDYALKLLNIRPRSKEELKQLLAGRDFSLEEMEQAISHLVQLGYVDDIKFMESWCYYRQQISPKSRDYVRRELAEKGISTDDLDAHYDEFYSEEEEINCLKRLMEKKLWKAHPMGMGSKENRERKMIASLLRKGFNHHLILEIFTQLEAKHLDIYGEK